MSQEPITNKSLGQHWLYDVTVLSDIAACADLSDQDTVLEIGSGLGTLTSVLTTQAKRVIAIEYDERLAQELPARVKANNLEVVSQDILRYDFSRMPAGYKIVANIPYYLTSNLIRTISETSNPPVVAVLLVQKEVAQRVAAQPGGMSILSVTAQFYWEVDLGNIVPARLFTPPPKIDSQILILNHRSAPLFNDIESKLFFRLVKAGFSQRRKTLLNSLSGGLHLDRAVVRAMCKSAGIEEGRRAQTLTLQEWHDLYVSVFSTELNP
jgi:16S rRNA (adenine1518-N6/adenine1519-N6)-dimethyltransferase